MIRKLIMCEISKSQIGKNLEKIKKGKKGGRSENFLPKFAENVTFLSDSQRFSASFLRG